MNINKNTSVIMMPLLSAFIIFSCNRMENTDDIPGDKNAFDPIIAIPEVTAFAGDDVVLLSLEAWLIKPDGTIDVEAEYRPSVTYRFIKKLASEKEENVQSDVPMGVIQTAKDTTEKAELIIVRIIKPYTEKVETIDFEDNVVDENYKHGGMSRENKIKDFSSWVKTYQISQAAPTPLSFSIIWQKAIDLGAPSDNAVANIKYDSKLGYTFEISQTDYKFKFNTTGKQID